MKNILSVDLESFTHREFDIKNRKVMDNNYTVKVTQDLLKLLKKYNTKITFFIVGEIYQWYPNLIEQIDAEGHEIAYHTHRHILLKNKKILLNELELSKAFLKKYKPKGFRAPRMYLQKEYLKTLAEFGFTYDSSTYGTYTQRNIYDGITEIPVSVYPYLPLSKSINFPQHLTKKLMLKSIPYGSGIGISIFQKKLQLFIDNTNKKNEPAVIFLHPWQLLPYDQELIKKTLKNLPRFIYKRNITNTLEYLLSKNTFIPFNELIKPVITVQTGSQDTKRKRTK